MSKNILQHIIRLYTPLALLFIWLPCQAAPLVLDGRWFEAGQNWSYGGQVSLESTGLIPASSLNKTGGHYFFQADFEVVQGIQVLDFKNSSVIGLFHHRILDRQGNMVAEAEGGIQSPEDNPFFLRHGREFHLQPGHYRLISEVASPFFLAQPVLYVDSLEHYRQAIKPGNALVLLCMGVLFGLVFYYVALAIVRRDATDALYASFILGNLIYNGAALLVWQDLLGAHRFYFISLPILFSNIIYVLFVLSLLEIKRETHYRLYRTGTVLLALLVIFAGVGLFKLNWSLELDRIGVGLFISFGLAMGVIRARQGYYPARYYLAAVIIFFALAALSISLSELDGVYSIYIEHLGLAAVTVEALLLALVLAGQFALLNVKFEMAHEHATQDALTGLKNRRAFFEASAAEVERSKRYGHPLTVIFLDLDNFKQLNDTKGHDTGDAALKAVAGALQGALRLHDLVARLGGDEFAVLLPETDYDASVEIGRKIYTVLKSALHDFSPVTGSIGVIWFRDANLTFPAMMKAADELMYEAKEGGKDNIRFRCYDSTTRLASVS